MPDSLIETSLLKQAINIAEQGIITGFSAAKPGVNGEEIEMVVQNWLITHGADLSCTFDMTYGKTISPDVEVLNEIKEGDFFSINLTGWANNVAFDLKRVTVVGQPTTHQKDYLDHLLEATNWMIEAIVPGRKMTFYPAESRGRLITPIAYEIEMDNTRVPRITAREQFTLPVGMILCVAPTLKSPLFGTMTQSKMIALTENGVKILS